MARIRGVDSKEAGLFTRAVYWMTKRKLGRLALPVQITAHHTRLLRAMGEMEMGQAAAHSVEAKLKELAGIFAATLIGCPFWIDIGSAVGRKAGIREAQLVALSDFDASPEFNELEKLVLRYAAAMTCTPVEIPDELFASLRSHFTEKQLVELTSAIAWENYRARFNHAFGIGAEGFSEGAFCPMPQH